MHMPESTIPSQSVADALTAMSDAETQKAETVDAPESIADTGTPAEPAEQADGTDTDGAGSKRAVLADLAKERAKAKAAQEQLDNMVAVLRKATGEDNGEKPKSADELARALAEKSDQVTERERRLAVYEQAPAGVDVARLMDSRTFDRALADVDPSDPKAVKASIKAFVDAHPDFKSSQSGGDLSAGHVPTTAPTATGADLMAAGLAAALR